MNRSRAVSPSPADSHTSSETSETQSVSDDPSTFGNVSKPQISKPIKRGSGAETSKERPPWRPVSVATPSKADKSALLKAKMLDATRRAMLLQRISHVSTQTDPAPIVLMRDAELDAQTDLITKKEVSVETDGSVTIRSDSLKGFILTQTVGQMTDAICTFEIPTQTARPKTSMAFTRRVAHRNSSLDDILLQNANKLQHQMDELEAIEASLRGTSGRVSDQEHSSRKTLLNPNSDEFDNELDLHINLLSEPTVSSWDNNDLLWDDYDERMMRTRFAPNLMRISDPTIKSSIARRLSNMQLSPVPRRRPTNVVFSRPIRPQAPTPDAKRQLFNELLYETNALIKLLDDATLRINGAKHTTLESKRPVSPLPDSKWDAVVMEQYQRFSANLQRYEARHARRCFKDT